MQEKGGRAHYGQAIGIITLDTKFPRIAGDIGNATTFRFPVKFVKVKGATPDRVVKRTDRALLTPFIEAARELERDGVRAITTSCGFLAIFQKDIAAAVKIPVFTSALMLVPMVSRMVGQERKVGVVTANSDSLTEDHLRGAGAQDIPIAIGGMQKGHEFMRILNDETELDPAGIESELVRLGREMLRQDARIGAFVLECTNLAPYSKALAGATGLPVFDIVHLVNFVHDSVIIGDRFSQGHM